MRDSFSRLRQLEHHINDSVRLYDNVQADDYPAHWNNSFEVIMPVENEYTVYVGETAYVVQPEEILDVQRQIAAFLPDSLTVVQTAAFYLEVIPRVINKGQGILDICKTLGIRAEEVIAFGDAENDIPMLKTAGMGVAMGNADEAVKAAANHITLSKNDDGIAAAISALCD